MKKTAISTLVISALMIGCATTHPGWKAKQVNADKPRNLIVSIHKDEDLSDKANAFYDFTIENKELGWLRVESAEVQFADNENLITNIIVGKDLVSWADSQNQKAKTQEHNMNMVTTAAIIGGTALALASGKSNSDLSKVGAAVAVGGIGVQAARDIKKDIKLAEQSTAVPETHILGGPFTVPADGIVKRWMLLGYPQKQRPATGNLILKTVEGEQISYAFTTENPSRSQGR